MNLAPICLAPICRSIRPPATEMEGGRNARVVLAAFVVPLCVLLAPAPCGAQAAQMPEPRQIRQPAGELHYADFGDLNPRFSWMKEKPDLTFKVSSIDLGGCPEVMVLLPDAVRWALASEVRPEFSGFDSAEVYCRAEADGRRFVGIAFVVTAEWIPMFTCRLGERSFLRRGRAPPASQWPYGNGGAWL